jgi:excisionase family DNA binding protein
MDTNARLQPITVSISKTTELSGLGRTTIYDLMDSGRLESVKVGGRRLVIYSSLIELIAKSKATPRR